MARTLKEWPRKNSGGSKYPWGKWLNGQMWELTRKKDFDCTAASFRTTAISYARTRGWKIRTSMPSKNTIAVQRLELPSKAATR